MDVPIQDSSQNLDAPLISELPPPPVTNFSIPPLSPDKTEDDDAKYSREFTVVSSPVLIDDGISKISFQIPGKAIYNVQDLQCFLKSRTYSELMIFIRMCNEKVKGKKISDIAEVSQAITDLERMLDTLSGWVDEIPPLQQPMRFGNKSFRLWHDRLVQGANELVSGFLPESLKDASIELSPFLCTSFGNETRIDYGTGHETNFVVFLCCLYKLRFITRDDLAALILRVFGRYLQLTHKLQTVYVMEPAGSHGVWGLDDYHCLSFLWGAAQLTDHPDILPSSIHNDAIVKDNKDEYLYLSGINFIKQLKKGAPFAESSPMLNDISGIPDWKKVNMGMFRLYEGEVLGKFPVIQHFLFGTILPASWIPASSNWAEVPFPQSPASGASSPPCHWNIGMPSLRSRSYSTHSTHSNSSSDDIPPLGPMSHAPWAAEPEPLISSPSGGVRASRTNSFNLDDQVFRIG